MLFPLRRVALASAFLLLVAGLPAADRPLAQVIDEALAQSAAQYRFLLQQLSDRPGLPRTFEHGKLVLTEKDWTVGFFPGSLWYLYEGTGDATWRTEAERLMPRIEAHQHDRGTHDVGFILFCSYGNGLRLTQNPAYIPVLRNGAASLASRFNPATGATRSWDHNADRWRFPVIIDNMMNLELLLWAAEFDPALRDIALRHADTTLRHHFRPDASCFHVVDYDPQTGAVRSRVTHQGAADSSAWARGQAWAIYGYTVLYRFTRDERYLAQARRTADFYRLHPRLPADKIPYWDFDAPNIPNAPRDASAAAVVASALFELADYLPGPERAPYREFAEATLRSLASPAYLAAPGENGGFLLKHCTGNLPRGSEVDTPLNYADYYFLEALLRARARLASGRVTVNLNPDWRFVKADPAGAESPAFDDAAWERVSLPHTFNDTDTFDNWSLPGHRGEQQQWSGRTWYRKTFAAPAAWRGRKVFIEFEAVRQVAEVYLNGRKLGTAKSGFTPFGFDLTPHLRFDAPNVLAVMADNRFMKDPMDPSLAPQAATDAKTHPNLGQLSKHFNSTIPASLDELQADQIPWNNPHWHPAHGGIYRNVRLHVTDPLHVTLPLYSFLETEGPYAYAAKVSAESAEFGLEVPVRNERTADQRFTVAARLVDADGRVAWEQSQDATLARGADGKFKFSAQLRQPRLWEPGYPHLYRCDIALLVDGTTVDRTSVPLGVRAIRWDAATGLWINGAHTKLHGWGQKSTNEWPGLGAALPDWLQFYTLDLMRRAGGNFVRWGHVPGGPAQIAAADRLGIVTLQPGVDGESDTVGGAWALRAATFRDVIVYFRNHPSIFLWEGGNQKISREHAAELRGYMDRFDPHGQRAYTHRRADAVTAEFMDVGIGTEGGREIARLPVVEGEYNREESPRRVWDDFSPPNFGYPEAKGQTYQLTSEQFAVNQVKHYVNKLGPLSHAGGANWIFSDTTSGGRVAVEVARASGEVDGVRLPKEAYFVTQVMFTYEPRVHIVGHWSYPAGTKKDVFAVANTGGEVELLLNGRSLGRAWPEKNFLYRFADVVFEPGELKAVAHDREGRATATATLVTAGPAVALRLSPIIAPDGWQADGSDVALVDVEAVDAAGRRVPTFQQRVDFSPTGPAVWRGGYNSGKLDSINHPFLDLEAGINRVALRASRTPGAVALTASSAGLAPAALELTLAAPRAQRAAWPVALPNHPQRQPHPEISAATRSHVAQGRDVGRFTTAFNYSGPASYIVHVETEAREGRNAYVDVDSPFGALPPFLRGADWVQLSNRDALYHAVDLMELSVKAGTRVVIAHDDRLARPPWLTKDYGPLAEKISVKGATLSLFAREFPTAASVTLGPNTEQSGLTDAAMYVVFIAAR